MPGKAAIEIAQLKPWNSKEEDAFLSLARTYEHLMQGFVDLFRSRHLTHTQYNILRILRGAGETGLNCSEAARRMITHDPDITRLFDRLETSGLIRRERGKEDRRVVQAFISAQGLELLASLDEPVRKLHEQQMGTLGAPQLQELVSLLERLRP